MKIKLSKNQCEIVGKKAGWLKTLKTLKTAQDITPNIDKDTNNMHNRMEKFFSPKITLKRPMMNGKPVVGYWNVDLVKDYPLARQFIEEAKIKSTGTTIKDKDLDAFLEAASNHGYSVETIDDE